MKYVSFVLVITLQLSAMFVKAQNPPSHDVWDKLTKKYVDKSGFVNYKGFKNDRAELNKYLELLSESSPSDKWSRNEQMAFWINAYNAFTVDLILQHYPVSSIKDIGAAIKIPFVNTPWDIKFIRIGGNKYDLNNLEHGILRKKFDDPRIHFAVNCASYSCPALRNEAYTAAKLDAQLDDAGRDFLRDPTKNKVSANNPQLSKLFSWYKGDFTKKSSLITFLNKYSSVKINEKADIDYMKYDWTLNEQK
jgi:hypothetical protein